MSNDVVWNVNLPYCGLAERERGATSRSMSRTARLIRFAFGGRRYMQRILVIDGDAALTCSQTRTRVRGIRRRSGDHELPWALARSGAHTACGTPPPRCWPPASVFVRQLRQKLEGAGEERLGIE